MTWITDNKGAGPWDFVPQLEKCGYVNNPRWAANRASDIDHEPCGYWPKGGAAPPTPANLYGLTTTGGEIWAVYYDGDSLSWVGSYDSPIDANGLALYNGNLITVAGTGATAVIREVSTAPPLSVVADYSVLLANDLPSINQYTTILHAADIDKFFIVGGGVNGRIVRCSKTLAREARGVYGTVITGTDGHLYVLTSSGFTWNNNYKPVTGANWNVFWDPIDDDVCDSPITAWGGNAYPTYTGTATVSYANGYLYVSINQSLNLQAISKIHATTLAIDASVNLTFAGKPLVYGGVVYVLDGLTTGRVYALSASDLSQIAVSPILSYGRLLGGVGNGDLAVIDGRLIVTTIPYISNSGLFALDLNTLEVLDSVPYSAGAGGPIYQCLARIDDTTAVIAENNGVGIAHLDGLRVPGGKSQMLEQSDPPYLSFDKYVYTGFQQQWVLAQPTSGETQAVSARCGTSPVWPMPA